MTCAPHAFAFVALVRFANGAERLLLTTTRESEARTLRALDHFNGTRNEREQVALVRVVPVTITQTETSFTTS